MTPKHKFFHFDTAQSLSSGLLLSLDVNGLSRFGRHYVGLEHQVGIAPWPRALYREKWLEALRATEFPHRPTRYASLFAAMSISDAIKHVERIRKGTPGFPEGELPVYEVYTQNFHVADMMWLDIDGLPHNLMLERYRKYWAGELTNDRKHYGLDRDPLMEVMLSLPVHVGEMIQPSSC